MHRAVPDGSRGTAGQHAPASSRRRSTSAARSATVRTAAASSSLSATRNRSSRPTTSVSRPTESSCRSTTRSSEGFGSRERPSSSRSTRAISPSTSSMRNEPRHAGELALPRRSERLLFDAHPHAQQRQVDERERDGAEEGAVGKRDAEHLDGDGQIVRVAQEAVGASAHGRFARHDDHAHVPAPSQAADRPPAQDLRADCGGGTDPAEDTWKRPVEKQHFRRTGRKEQRVHCGHPAEMRSAALDARARESDARIAVRKRELRDALYAEQRQEDEVSRHHSSNTISEQKPGPMARRSPRSPGRATPEASRSESTKRTEAEERFPTLCRESQLFCIAAREISSASSIASSTLGPPVWQMKCAMSDRRRPCARRKPSTSERSFSRTSCGTPGESTTLNPESTTSQPITRSV